MKIKNGLDTTAGGPQQEDGQEDLKSPNLPPADGGNSVNDGGDADESRQEDGSDSKGLPEKLKAHSKGGGDSQPYNGHRWGLGCCHYVRQVAEEDTFRLRKTRLNSTRVLTSLQRIYSPLLKGIQVTDSSAGCSSLLRAASCCRFEINTIFIKIKLRAAGRHLHRLQPAQLFQGLGLQGGRECHWKVVVLAH